MTQTRNQQTQMKTMVNVQKLLFLNFDSSSLSDDDANKDDDDDDEDEDDGKLKLKKTFLISN